MSNYEHHTPEPPSAAEEFWAACRRHELVVQRCGECGRATFIPQDFCRHCFSDDLSWSPSSGRGVVKSYTTVWRPATPKFEPPYIVAVIDLEADGYVMYSNLVDINHDEVAIGLPVEVVWHDSGDVTLPKFRPASAHDEDVASHA